MALTDRHSGHLTYFGLELRQGGVRSTPYYADYPKIVGSPKAGGTCHRPSLHMLQAHCWQEGEDSPTK